MNDILSSIPHREPFLLVDEIVEQEEARIVRRKRFSGEEYFFAGHYPEFPVVPGVLLCEAAMQAGAILLSRLVAEADGGVPVATRIVLRLPLAANTIIWVFLVGYRASRAQNQKNTNDKQHRHATANRRDVCPPFPCVRFASGSGVCRREARRR